MGFVRLIKSAAGDFFVAPESSVGASVVAKKTPEGAAWSFYSPETGAYTLTASGRTDPLATLSTNGAGVVDMWEEVDSSGRQRWFFEVTPAGVPEFRVSVWGGRGLEDPAKRYLTLDPTGGFVSLAALDKASPNQRWSILASAPTPTPTPTPGDAWPVRYFAPYADMTGWPTPDLAKMSRDSGTKLFGASFVVADSKNGPSWGGIAAISALAIDKIAALRAAGGDVFVSYGGQQGTELAQAIADVDALVAAYESVVKTTGCKRMDMDIEGSAVGDRASVSRRNRALAKMQARDPSLIVSYCLPVMQTGLDADALWLLGDAASNGVGLESVGIMTMYYGTHEKQMGKAAVAAATRTKAQLSAIPGYATVPVCIIPAIGVNGSGSGEVFTTANATEVLAFANKTPWIKSLRFWSASRDFSSGADDEHRSGVGQTPYQFAKTFQKFA